MAANMLAGETDYPVVEKVADASFKFANKIKGKREPKGKNSNYQARQGICAKPK